MMLTPRPELRALCHLWRTEPERCDQPSNSLSFSDFVRWLEMEGHEDHIHRMTQIGSLEDTKAWFDRDIRAPSRPSRGPPEVLVIMEGSGPGVGV